MKPDRWRQVDKVFEAALELDLADRPAFLDKACGNDLELRREVEKMLKFDEQATDFIEDDAFSVAAGLMTGQSQQLMSAQAPTEKRDRKSVV